MRLAVVSHRKGLWHRCFAAGGASKYVGGKVGSDGMAGSVGGDEEASFMISVGEVYDGNPGASALCSDVMVVRGGISPVR